MDFSLYIISISMLASFFLYIIHCFKTVPKNWQGNRILLLTAHPDDETMFFGPFITSALAYQDVHIFILCLSTGNNENLGRVREKELIAATKMLGVKEGNVKILNVDEFQDGPENDWKQEHIAKELKDATSKWKIDTIVTFDNHGVSSHLNHVSLCRGAMYYTATFPQSTRISLYTLNTTSVFRKYISWLDLAYTMLKLKILDKVMKRKPDDNLLFISNHINLWKTHCAMHEHKSQFVWFRRLYVIFSRYMVINELNRIPI